MNRLIRILAPLLVLVAAQARAHEFWIEPFAYQIAPGETIQGQIKIGQSFGGSIYSYLPNSFVRFDVVTGGEAHPVTGRIGDRPALSYPDAPEGLAIVVHETVDNRLTYTERQKFVDFVNHKDAAWVLDEHARRGLPDTGFIETYRRYAKTLVAVGAGDGADAPQGLLWELVALENPYTGDLSDGFDVQLLHEGAPVPEAQIELFAKSADDSVETTYHRTGTDGVVTLPVVAGTAYLVDSVRLEPRVPSEATQGAVWHSLWASLVFRTPD